MNDIVSGRWFRLGLGGLSGLCYGLALPKAEWALLAWVCLIPLLVPLLRGDRPLLIVGLAAGLVAGIFRVYWIAETLELYGGVPFFLGVFTTFLLIAYLALYPAVFLALLGRAPLSSPLFPWIAASLWVLLEWAQSWIISGFPWSLLGYTLYKTPAVLQLASLTGVYGLSFLLVLVNAALFQLLWVRPRRLLAHGLAPLLVLVSTLGWGLHRLDTVPETGGPPLQVGIVQGNIEQGDKWRDRRLRATQIYIEESEALPDELDLIVFPETALPFYFTDPYYSTFSVPVAQLAQRRATPMLVGSLEGRRGRADKIYNRAYLLDDQGQLHDYADKVHLVPFGEYLPFPWFFSYLGGLTAESGRFTNGEAHKALKLNRTGPAFGVFICYESIFPAITRELAQQGATFLINTTNDAWFGTTAAPHQHFSMAVVRAVETGRPVIRAANTGISGLISPTGEVLARTGLFKPVALTVAVQPQTAQTPYVRYGDVLLVFAALFLAFLVLARLWRRARFPAPR